MPVQKCAHVLVKFHVTDLTPMLHIHDGLFPKVTRWMFAYIFLPSMQQFQRFTTNSKNIGTFKFSVVKILVLEVFELFFFGSCMAGCLHCPDGRPSVTCKKVVKVLKVAS